MTTFPSPFGEPLPHAPEPGASPNACFLAGAVPHGAYERGRVGNSIIGSACTHIGGFLLAVFIIGRMPVTPPSTATVDDTASKMVWLNIPGPGRSGAGTGDGKPAPPRRGEPATAPQLAHEPLKDLPKPDPEINITPVDTSAIVELPGALTGLPTVSTQSSLLGDGRGLGNGRRGSGFGPGDGPGFGNDAFGPGNGVTMPRVVREVKPSYTAEAMRAKVQGAVIVEAIVREDGSVGQVRIVRSLDRAFGLDEEALKAVRSWRFTPGQRQGKNVPVIVQIELTFTLR